MGVHGGGEAHAPLLGGVWHTQHHLSWGGRSSLPEGGREREREKTVNTGSIRHCSMKIRLCCRCEGRCAARSSSENPIPSADAVFRPNLPFQARPSPSPTHTHTHARTHTHTPPHCFMTNVVNSSAKDTVQTNSVSIKEQVTNLSYHPA